MEEHFLDLLFVSGPMADVVSKRKGTVTYLQVLEMHGRLGPQQPRQRVLINLIAIRTETQPLNETLMVGDLSQNPPPPGTCSLEATPLYSPRVATCGYSKSATRFTQHIWRL